MPPRRPKPQPAPAQQDNEPKVGRNEPCPCGSGRKYKKCCYKEEETAAGGGQSVTT